MSARVYFPLPGSDKYRTQFPNGDMTQFKPSSQDNPNYAIISTVRCNLQSLLVYAAESMGGQAQASRWLHIFDENINNQTDPLTPTPLSKLQGKTPTFPPVKIAPGCNLDWYPHRDIKLDDYQTGVAIFLGQPFDLGIVVVVSSSEFITTLVDDPLDRIAVEAMFYGGQDGNGRIRCTDKDVHTIVKTK